MNASRNLDIVVSLKGLDLDHGSAADLGEAIRGVVSERVIRMAGDTDIVIGRVVRDGNRVSMEIAGEGHSPM